MIMKNHFCLIVILAFIGGCLQTQDGFITPEVIKTPEEELIASLNDKLPRIKFNEYLKKGRENDYAPYKLYNLSGLKDYKFVLKGEFPEVPKYLWAYKVDYKGFSLEEAQKIAKETFGMNAKPWGLADENSDRPTYYFEDGDYGLTIYCRHEGAGGEGRFTYALKEEISQKIEDKGISVTKEEAKQIADNFLKAHKLWPENQIKGCVIGESTTITYPGEWGDGNPNTVINGYTIYYTASVDDYSGIGNTLDIRVKILADGIIGEVSKRWMNFKKYKKYPTKTLLEAFESVQDDISNTNWWAPRVPGLVGGATISFYQICYYSEDFKYEYLQPCYRFDITKKDMLNDGILIPAIKDSYYLEPTKLSNEK